MLYGSSGSSPFTNRFQLKQPFEDYFSKVQKNNKIFTGIEKIPVKILKTSQECSQLVADAIANTILEKSVLGQNCV